MPDVYKKLKPRTIKSFNKLLNEIEEFDGNLELEIIGKLSWYGLDIRWNELDRYWDVCTGGISPHLDYATVYRDNVWEFCEQFNDQAKMYELIKFMKESRPYEMWRKRHK